MRSTATNWGFEVTFQAEPDDLFFGIVKRGEAMNFLKIFAEDDRNRFLDEVNSERDRL